MKLYNYILATFGLILIGFGIGVIVGYEICEHDSGAESLTQQEIEMLYNFGEELRYPFHENYDTCVADSATWIIPESVEVKFLFKP